MASTPTPSNSHGSLPRCLFDEEMGVHEKRAEKETISGCKNNVSDCSGNDSSNNRKDDNALKVLPDEDNGDEKCNVFSPTGSGADSFFTDRNSSVGGRESKSDQSKSDKSKRTSTLLDYILGMEEQFGINNTEDPGTYDFRSFVDEVERLENELGIRSEKITNGVGNRVSTLSKDIATDDELEPNNISGRKSRSDIQDVDSLVDDERDKTSDFRTLLDEIKVLRERIQDVENRNDTDDDHNDDHENRNYPQDCYSLIALNGPTGGKWSKRKIGYFSFGLMVFVFQILLITLLFVGGVNVKLGTVEDPGNPWSGYPIAHLAAFLPPNVKHIVRASQVLSILAYIIFPCSSQQDIAKALQLFPLTSNKGGDSMTSLRFSCVLRALQGVCATITVWVLVMTATSVVDIILNFTAVSFVSSIDDDAFSLAKAGVFGKGLRKETKRVGNTKLPDEIFEKAKHVWYWYWIMMACTGLFLLGFQLYVIAAQDNPEKWITKTLRVEFDGPDFRQYSGCYEIKKGSQRYGRFRYNSINQRTNTSFGFCLDDREWVLFDSNTDDPCVAKRNGAIIAQSPDTDAIDISSSFEETWKSSSGTPLDMYFFDSSMEYDNKLYCNMTIGDGVCDLVFNHDGYGFDGGDCCAHTCNGFSCGRGALTNAFGVSNTPEYGFPNCNDGDLIPLTIRLNSLTSSRQYINTEKWYFNVESESEWRNEPPLPTLLSLTCNNKPILKVQITSAMENGSETVLVEDGSHCEVDVKNSTGSIDVSKTWLPITWADGSDLFTTPPLWYINYTIFHQTKIGDHEEQIEILNRESSQEGIANLTLIRNCFIEELKNQTDLKKIYDSELDSSEKAIAWLRGDDPKISQCGEQDFLERYALAEINFAMTETTRFISRNEHCAWASVLCDVGGRVKTLELPQTDLKGRLTSSIGLFRSLEEISLPSNDITALPTEIGLLSRLSTLNLISNRVSSFPTNIDSLTALKSLSLGHNGLTRFPEEIGILTSLEFLGIAGNNLTFLSSAIGLLTNLHQMALDYNSLTSLPTEFGSLKNLRYLSASHKNMLSSVPTQFGSLSNLKYLHLHGNMFTSIPTEIWSLTSLLELSFGHNQLTSIPTEIGLLTTLQKLYIHENKISSIPTEIGQLENLQLLWTHENLLTSLPTEMARLTSLEDFQFSGNSNITCDHVREQFPGLPCT